MLLRIYGLLILTYDVVALFFFLVTSLIESAYHLFSPPQPKTLTKDIVLIAGAAHGLGKALAADFTMHGATVICCDIDTRCNEESAESADSLGYGIAHAYAYTCDITKREQVMAMAARIQKEIGTVTVIINCCNLPSPNIILEHTTHDAKKIFNIAVLSHLWILQAFLPGMKKKRRGHLVMMSSLAGLSGVNELLPLSSAQFAVQGIAESLNEELRFGGYGKNIKVTLVHIYPLIVPSDMADSIQFRLPSYYGIISPAAASKLILDAIKRNYLEVSIPGYLLYIGKLVRVLPRKAIFATRELLNTGVDFS
ncbi:hypothetical protein L9F63_022715 [Diploptera punctata]|uniref:Uncharacterized protein n=1 Tax=Diploptera punctata TaxID=6984 RepID=A0AAD7ZLK8_DIPPU|nr:hypothetical protein L9F63_022715 [Diploptera punctata]